MLRARLAVAALALTVSSVLIAGCAGAAAPAVTPVPVPSTDDAESLDAEIDAAWLDDGSAVGILTYGSSTCLPTAGW